jgi:hypothetical protein
VSTGTLHGQLTQSAAVLAQQFQQQKLITSGKITKAEVTQATRHRHGNHPRHRGSARHQQRHPNRQPRNLPVPTTIWSALARDSDSQTAGIPRC